MLTLISLLRFTERVRQWVVQVGLTKSVELRKKVLETYLSSIKLSSEEDIPVGNSTASLSYQVVYPILLHSQKRGDLHQVVDCRIFYRLTECNNKIMHIFEKIQKDVYQDQVPYLYQYQRVTYQQYQGYYQAVIVDLLQICSFISSYCMQHFESDYKKQFLQFGFQMAKSNDKLLAFFSKLYLGKFFRTFQLGYQQDSQQTQILERILKIYVQVLKYQDENVSHQDQEVLFLCRRIVQVVIPYLDTLNKMNQTDKEQQQHAWIYCTLQIFR